MVSEVVRAETLIPQVFVVHPRRKSGSWPTTTRASPAWASNVCVCQSRLETRSPSATPPLAGRGFQENCRYISVMFSRRDPMGLYGLSSKEIARDGCFHYLPTSEEAQRGQSAWYIASLDRHAVEFGNPAAGLERGLLGCRRSLGTATPDPSNPPSRRQVPRGSCISAGNPTWDSCHVDDVLRGC